MRVRQSMKSSSLFFGSTLNTRIAGKCYNKLNSLGSLFHLHQSFGQFDIDAPWIGEEGNAQAHLRKGTVRPVEFHTVSFELFAEGFEIGDFEADVINAAPFRPGQFSFGWFPAQIDTGNVGCFERSACSRKRTEHFRVPRALFVDLLDREVNVIMHDGIGLFFVFGELDFDAVREFDEHLARLWIFSEKLAACGRELRLSFIQTLHFESEMIDHAAVRSSGWRAFRQQNLNSGELAGFQSSELDHLRAERVDPKLFVSVEVGDPQMQVPHGNAFVISGRQLGKNGGR